MICFVELINAFTEMYIIGLFYNKLLKYKYKNKLPLIAIYFSSSLIISFAAIKKFDPILLLIITSILLLFISIILYDGKMVYKVFYSFIYLMIILIADPILVGFTYILNSDVSRNYFDTFIGRTIGMVISKILYLWMVVSITRLLMKKVKELPLKYWISIILTPVISIVILYGITVPISHPENAKFTAIYIISIVGIIYINLSMLNFFESYSKQIKLSFLETVAEREAENYKLLRISYKEMKKLKHDFQNELAVLNDLITNHRYMNAEIHIDALLNEIDNFASLCYTGNEAVDSLINIKGNTSRQYNIKFITKIKIVSEITGNSLELCRIFGNALDNAIEACLKVDVNERYICVSINEIEDSIMIEISNSSIFADTDDLSTTKSERSLHGYGIQSIKSSAEKLGGVLNFIYANNAFTLKLLLKKDNCDDKMMHLTT